MHLKLDPDPIQGGVADDADDPTLTPGAFTLTPSPRQEEGLPVTPGIGARIQGFRKTFDDLFRTIDAGLGKLSKEIFSDTEGVLTSTLDANPDVSRKCSELADMFNQILMDAVTVTSAQDTGGPSTSRALLRDGGLATRPDESLEKAQAQDEALETGQDESLEKAQAQDEALKKANLLHSGLPMSYMDLPEASEYNNMSAYCLEFYNACKSIHVVRAMRMEQIISCYSRTNGAKTEGERETMNKVIQEDRFYTDFKREITELRDIVLQKIYNITSRVEPPPPTQYTEQIEDEEPAHGVADADASTINSQSEGNRDPFGLSPDSR
jgi:hypothetical protein